MSDGKVIFDTELNTTGVQTGMSQLEGSIGKSAGGIVGKLAGAFSVGALVKGFADLATAGVKYNSQMESYRANFAVMLGDEAKALEYVEQLRVTAAKTPFGMEDLAGAAQTMMSFGMSAEDTSVAMQQLGDIALGDKQKFQSLSLAFAQVSAAGKLSGQDLLQMVNAGFNPLNTLAEATGTSLGDLKEVMAGGKGSAEFQKQMKAAQREVKKMGDGASDSAKLLARIGEEGMISAEMVGLAMEIETSPGGRFYNGMEKASQTMEGQLSTLGDNSMQLVGNLFRPLSNLMSGTLLPMANGLVESLNTLFEPKTTTYDILAEVDPSVAAAIESLDGLETRLDSIQRNYLENSLKIQVDADNATLLAQNLEQMFSVKPKLEDWTEDEKAEAIRILGDIHALFPDFDITPDEAGLLRVQELLTAEGESVTGLIDQYAQLQQARLMETVMGDLLTEKAQAEVDLKLWENRRDDIAQELADRQKGLDQWQRYYAQTAFTDYGYGDGNEQNVATYRKFLGEQVMQAHSENDYGLVETDVIQQSLDALYVYSRMAGGFAALDLNADQYSYLVDSDGKLRGADQIAGNAAAIEALVYAVDASEHDAAKRISAEEKEVNDLSDALSAADGTVASAKATVAGLNDQVTEMTSAISALTGEATTTEVTVDDQATDKIEDIDQLLDQLEGKSSTVYVRTMLLGDRTLYEKEAIPGFATGLPYVPYDEFPALLHEGEAVLTAKEAAIWRAGQIASAGGHQMGGGFNQTNNFYMPVKSPDEFANEMHVYATYGLDGEG